MLIYGYTERQTPVPPSVWLSAFFIDSRLHFAVLLFCLINQAVQLGERLPDAAHLIDESLFHGFPAIQHGSHILNQQGSVQHQLFYAVLR